MKFAFLLLMITLTALAPFSISFAEGGYANPGVNTAEVAILVEADQAAVSVTVISEHRDPARRFEEIEKAQEALFSRARSSSEIEVEQGPIALLSGSISDGYLPAFDVHRDERSAVQMQVLADISPGDTLYEGAARIQEFLERVDLPSRTRLVVGRYRLAVSNPEQYRGILLRKISEYTEYTKSTTGFSGVITLTGLQGPILVRQADERNVELFIDYTMTLETAAR